MNYMKERFSLKSNILIGALLFGLFFGAGNLIFPVHMGQLAGENTLKATIGFLLTGVGLPLLGVISSALSQSESLYDMARPVSRIYSILFTCMLYLTIGPLFAIPRTATVAFEVGLNPFIDKEHLQITLPKVLKEGVVVSKIIDFAHKYLPGFDYGFGWILPALVGCIIGTIIWRVRVKSN